MLTGREEALCGSFQMRLARCDTSLPGTCRHPTRQPSWPG